jgi:N-acetylglucosamine-6-phosphate deacetylase
MPTLASSPMRDFERAAERIASVAALPTGARFVGLHLEGRYLHPEKRGAHAAELLAPLCADELRALYHTLCQPFRKRGLPIPFRAAAALELDEDGSFAAAAGELGIRLALGHTTASYERAMRAIEQGVDSFTHLFNAMPPLHHRGGGAVTACLEAAANGADIYGELICDGVHISPEMVRLAYRSLGPEHTLLITDSMAGAGCPDGQYFLAGLRVTVKDGRALTDDGTIAGSTLTLWDAVCNLSTMCNIPLAEAITCATYNPARLCGLASVIGSLEVGARADMLVIDAERQTLLAVYLAGKCCTEVATE